MWFSRKQVAKAPDGGGTSTPVQGAAKAPVPTSTKSRGDAAEQQALRHLVGAGMKLVENNYRTPGRGGGEIDLIMRDTDGTLVFVEVRQRASDSHGGAGASISAVKQGRIVFAAKTYLTRFTSLPPCRFDVVLVHGERMEWLKAAFDAQ
jgi:putative endonuclease